MLIKSADMSNTIPDLKVNVTFLTYFAAKMLDLSTEMKAAKIIQRHWRIFAQKKRALEIKMKYK